MIFRVSTLMVAVLLIGIAQVSAKCADEIEKYSRQWKHAGERASDGKGQGFLGMMFLTTSGPLTTSSLASGCSSDVGSDRRAFIQNEKLKFVAENYDQLEEDISHGRGETLHSLFGLMQCDPGGVPMLSIHLQTNMARLVPSERNPRIL
ncbi:MAG TPA: DUF3015 family protein, partial [bacterium]